MQAAKTLGDKNKFYSIVMLIKRISNSDYNANFTGQWLSLTKKVSRFLYGARKKRKPNKPSFG